VAKQTDETDVKAPERILPPGAVLTRKGNIIQNGTNPVPERQ
jgi:hypothetical protein